jgi:hypothetical protein
VDKKTKLNIWIGISLTPYIHMLQKYRDVSLERSLLNMIIVDHHIHCIFRQTHISSIHGPQVSTASPASPHVHRNYTKMYCMQRGNLLPERLKGNGMCIIFWVPQNLSTGNLMLRFQSCCFMRSEVHVLTPHPCH